MEKKCRKCEKIKQISEFYPDNRSEKLQDELGSFCKSCMYDGTVRVKATCTCEGTQDFEMGTWIGWVNLNHSGTYTNICPGCGTECEAELVESENEG